MGVKLFLSVIDPLVTLLCIMIISSIFREQNIMGSVYAYLEGKIKSKRVLVSLLSLIFGVLPIPNRISFVCGILNSIQEKNKNNQKMGVVAYLASHHYYLWSPIEKSVIITCGIVGITYAQFMQYMLVPTILAVLFSITYIFFNVSEDEIYIHSNDAYSKVNLIPAITFFWLILLAPLLKTMFTPALAVYTTILILAYRGYNINDIDFNLLGLTAVVILFGGLLNEHSKIVTEYIKYLSSATTLTIVLGVAYLASFVLGSSAKFATICGLLTNIFGVKYLPLFYIVEYAGYLISPAHKCVVIGKMFFKTPVGMYFTPIILLSLILMGYAVLTI